MSNSTGPRQQVSRSMTSSPRRVLSKLPRCGSPCRSCSAVVAVLIALPTRLRGVAEEFPVGVKKFGGPRAVSNQSLRFGDSIERHKG